MFPPLTIQTIFFASRLPDCAAAKAAAPAPSVMMRHRSANVLTAAAISFTLTTIVPETSDRTNGHISAKIAALPIPSMKVGVRVTLVGSPDLNDAASGAAVSASTA